MPEITIHEDEILGSGKKQLTNSTSMIYIPSEFKGMNIRWYVLKGDQP